MGVSAKDGKTSVRHAAIDRETDLDILPQHLSTASLPDARIPPTAGATVLVCQQITASPSDDPEVLGLSALAPAVWPLLGLKALLRLQVDHGSVHRSMTP